MVKLALLALPAAALLTLVMPARADRGDGLGRPCQVLDAAVHDQGSSQSQMEFQYDEDIFESYFRSLPRPGNPYVVDVRGVIMKNYIGTALDYCLKHPDKTFRDAARVGYSMDVRIFGLPH